MLTLYQFEISPFCDKIRRVLNVKRVPYQTREVGLLEAQWGYRRINPSGKTPALADEAGRIVCDSTDIAYYLEERYPEPPLVPREPRARALVHVLEDWADESLYFFEMRLRFGIAHNRVHTLPRLLAHENAVMKAVAPWILPRAIRGQTHAQGVGRKSDAQVVVEVGRHLDALAALLTGHAYLVGDALTLADIAVHVQLTAIRDSVEGGAEIGRRGDLGGYMERIERATQPATAPPVT